MTIKQLKEILAKCSEEADIFFVIAGQDMHYITEAEIDEDGDLILS